VPLFPEPDESAATVPLFSPRRQKPNRRVLEGDGPAKF